MTTRSHPAGPLAPDLARIRRALAGTEIAALTPQGRHAAVALILAGETSALHVCLIRRAELERDRWSGHMALPGGRVEPDDASPLAAAIRETREEVGLRLDEAACLGALARVPVSSGGKPTGITLSPFVFHLGDGLEAPVLNGEVTAAFWVPLAHLLDARNAGHRLTPRDGVVLRHPAVLYEGQYIWGLTYRVLGAFFEQLELEIARPE